MDPIDKKKYGSNAARFIREYCKEKDIDQKRWKALFGFYKQQLTDWKNGDYLPTTEQLLVFSRHTGEHIEDILGWTPPPKFRPIK